MVAVAVQVAQSEHHRTSLQVQKLLQVITKSSSSSCSCRKSSVDCGCNRSAGARSGSGIEKLLGLSRVCGDK